MVRFPNSTTGCSPTYRVRAARFTWTSKVLTHLPAYRLSCPERKETAQAKAPDAVLHDPLNPMPLVGREGPTRKAARRPPAKRRALTKRAAVVPVPAVWGGLGRRTRKRSTRLLVFRRPFAGPFREQQKTASKDDSRALSSSVALLHPPGALIVHFRQLTFPVIIPLNFHLQQAKGSRLVPVDLPECHFSAGS